MYLKIAFKSFLIGLLAIFVIAALSNKSAKAEGHGLTFAVSGVVSSVKVKVGDEVKVGTILAVLDIAPFDAAKRAAEATFDLAKLILTLSEVRLDQAQKLFDALSTSGEELEKAKIEHAKALSDFKVAKSRTEIATWRLQRATLKAPFVGIVTAIPGYPGKVINKNEMDKSIVVVDRK